MLAARVALARRGTTPHFRVQQRRPLALPMLCMSHLDGGRCDRPPSFFLIPMNNQIINQLKQPLDVDRISKRQGSGGIQLSYLESHNVIDHLNQIFGFDGWSYSLLDFQTVPAEKGMIFRAHLRLVVRFDEREVTREDVGIGVAASNKAEQLEKGSKEAVSDALKRCSRTLGDQFGNSLYDKDAPEHKGEQQERLATEEQLRRFEERRDFATRLGIKNKDGSPPRPLPPNAPEALCLERCAKLEEAIAKKEAKAQPPEQMPDTAPTDVAETKTADTSQQGEAA